MENKLQGTLKRELGLVLVTFYGLGTIVGAGIYVLVGEVASISGPQMPWAFLVAGLIAALTGACYAELSARFPKAAGAVLYIDIAFGKPAVSQLTGLLLLLTGIVSAATIARGFVGYLQLYVEVTATLSIALLCVFLGAVAAIGIKESAGLVSVITLAEVIGLLLVISLSSQQPRVDQLAFQQGAIIGPVFMGAFLAFYAFIGFEDMVNLAEEMKSPTRDMPRALFLAISASTLLYLAIAWVATGHTELEGLAESSSPLAYMLGDRAWAVSVIGVISLVAITNGALTQIIMGSRVLYGMASRKILPAIFAQVNAKTGTPLFSTLVITLAVLGFALWLPLVTLAKITSFIMLIIFAAVNLALLCIKRQSPVTWGQHFQVPSVIPAFALVINLALLLYQSITILS